MECLRRGRVDYWGIAGHAGELTWLALDASVTFLVAAGYVGRHRLVRLRAG